MVCDVVCRTEGHGLARIISRGDGLSPSLDHGVMTALPLRIVEIRANVKLMRRNRTG